MRIVNSEDQAWLISISIILKFFSQGKLIKITFKNTKFLRSIDSDSEESSFKWKWTFTVSRGLGAGSPMHTWNFYKSDENCFS